MKQLILISSTEAVEINSIPKPDRNKMGGLWKGTSEIVACFSTKEAAIRWNNERFGGR